MEDLELLRQGDPGARERWVSAWWPHVYRMALAMTGSDADAEDLAQETMMAGLAAIVRFRGESGQGTWLYAILVRKFRSQGRRRKAPPPPRGASPDPSVDAAQALLAALPPHQRIAAALFYIEDLSVEEIARGLGVPRPTVRWRLFRARQTLRRRLGDPAARRICEEAR